LPYDVDVKKVNALVDKKDVSPKDIRAAQREFDELAWEAFLALNWPATEKGEPDGKLTLTDATAPRVWLSWRPADTIFRIDGGEPTPWIATALQGKDELFRPKAAWRQEATANENFQAFSGPLVDQHGKWVRYQVLVNHEEFDYILENHLYNLEGQADFSQNAHAPDMGRVTLPADDAAASKHGAIEIKLAWKELDADEVNLHRFFTMDINIVHSDVQEKGKTEPKKETITAGLVGMHISMHTQSSPEWIWSTFEQVDNERPHDDGHGGTVANFENPKTGGCPAQGDPSAAVVNVLAKRNGYLAPGATFPVADASTNANTWLESKTKTPVQVCRVYVPPRPNLNPLDADLRADAEKLNGEVQEQLKKINSVFQYYELIDTQWPVHPFAPAVPGGAASAPESIARKVPGDVVPTFLVNTTMETFFQLGKQPAGPLEQDDRLAPGVPLDTTEVRGTESCVGCHYSAGICIGFRTVDGQRTPIFGENANFGRNGNGNFSWLFQIEGHMTSPAGGAPMNAEEQAALRHNPSTFLKSGGRAAKL
jgi:hypothetical protein